jgi:outer membrane protein OmpA-like peptidoglycan-associated protein
MIRLAFAPALVSIVLALSVPAQAADVPSADDIAGKLAAPPPSSSPATRSFGRGISVPNAKPDAPPTIDLSINFEFNSAELTPEGKVLVGNLGRALKDKRLAGARFRIEGHTDAKGEDAYNQALSERRAETVRRTLIASFGADSARIESVGLGEKQLLDAANPESGANRRVRVVNLGGER